MKVYNEQGMAQRNGTGMFPREVINRFPLLPLEEEGRLNDSPLRENSRGLTVNVTHPGRADTPGMGTSIPTFAHLTRKFCPRHAAALRQCVRLCGLAGRAIPNTEQ